jgi:hypothetical protein
MPWGDAGVGTGLALGQVPVSQPRGLAGCPACGTQRVHLEDLGVGNYLMVQATPLSPVPHGNGTAWTWGEIEAYERSPLNSGTQGD